jgi:hypothetical protein
MRERRRVASLDAGLPFELRADVVLTNISLPGASAAELVQRLRMLLPGTPLVVLTLRGHNPDLSSPLRVSFAPNLSMNLPSDLPAWRAPAAVPELEALAQLSDDWDAEGAPAPSAETLQAARVLVENAHRIGLPVLDIDADVLGGVGVWLSWPPDHPDGQAERWTWLSCMNSGARTVTLFAKRDGVVGSRAFRDGDAVAELERVKAFLVGGT